MISLSPEKIALLSSEPVREYLVAHKDAAPTSITLKPSPFEGLTPRDLSMQLSSRKKAEQKLPGWLNAPGVVFPETQAMEQCSSEYTALYKQRLFPEAAEVTDLTGGFGVDAAAIASIAGSMNYVERQEYLCNLAENNFRALQLTNVTVFNLELTAFLEQHPPKSGAYFFCDPARRDENQKKVFLLEDCSPDLTQLAPLLLDNHAVLVAKLSPLFDISRLKQAFGRNLKSVHVVAVKNECKELLIEICLGDHDTELVCVNLDTAQLPLSATLEEAKTATITYSEPLAYLYEPNAAILKAGAGDLAGSRYELQKLEANSHLFTSALPVTDFPGRSFRILGTYPLDKKEFSKIIPGKKANITVRNFPLKPEEIHKKLGFSTGGDEYLFATTTSGGKKVIIHCRKFTSSEKS
ncbi:MAG: hypothetical protein V4616_12350 [Bacteroidota bacterium]